jgi:hypothetical protein
MEFKIGDKVKWSSHAGGNYTTKEGVVVRVVKAGERIRKDDFEAIACREGAGARKWGGSWGARKHISYIVKVSFPGTAKTPQLYWPLTSRLMACPTS